jgi:hypothetical protein
MNARLRPEVKEKLCSALRSDEYVQGTGYLKQNFGNGDVRHCCLGVLTELAIADGVEMDVEVIDVGAGITHTSYDGATMYLPLQVEKWAFVEPTSDPEVTVKYVDEDHVGREDQLVNLNDDGEHTFEQIAGIIEQAL